MAEEETEQAVGEAPEKLEGSGGEPPDKEASEKGLLWVSLTALGVVYGDIGTNTLFAFRECFHGQHPVPPTPDNVLGVLSLIFWSLIIIISIKYIMYVMRMDNRGEGGILALMALLPEWRKPKSKSIVMIVGVFGAALLYGDGMVTPAISVLSAIEGLKVASSSLSSFVLPLTVIVLTLLFVFQKSGTSKIGSVFGPIMLVWFSVGAILGISGIVKQPQVLAAMIPNHAIRFMLDNHFQGFLVLGAVFLSVTGGEALYADLGHFGAKPIRVGWYTLVLPSLVLNYFGQGALLLTESGSTTPFFQLAPSWAMYPVVLLATAATVIASQSVISGVFSLSRQAALLGLLPLLRVVQTSPGKSGQIYVPGVNWLMMGATIALVIGFQSSSRLAGAYGVAVSTTMVITTFLAYFVTRELWKWNRLKSMSIALVFLTIDLLFFSSNMFRIIEGGWVPLAVGAFVFALMSTWRRGDDFLKQRLSKDVISLDSFVQKIKDQETTRVPGTAIFMTVSTHGTPPILLRHLKHNQVLHERVILLTVVIEDLPRIGIKDRIDVEKHELGIYRAILHLGFMDDPNIPDELRRIDKGDLDVDLEKVTYYVGSQVLIPSGDERGMSVWREKLFLLMARNATRSVSFYGLPSDQVIELGIQIRI